MIKKVFLIIGLLVSGFIVAVLIWFLVFLPARILQPLEFAPVELQKQDFESALDKISKLTTPGTTIILSDREASALLKTSIEKELGVPVTDLMLELRYNSVTAVFTTQISDIPTTGYLSFLLRKRDTEYTSTLIAADVTASTGGLMYRITDFRIGNFRVPHFILRKLVQDRPKRFDTVYISGIEIDPTGIRISSR